MIQRLKETKYDGNKQNKLNHAGKSNAGNEKTD